MATENFTENQKPESEELSQEFIDSLLEMEPAITEEQMYELGVKMADIDHLRRMRLMLVVLSKSMMELCKIGEGNLDVHQTMLEQAEAYLEEIKALFDFAEAAAWRMRIADCYVRAVAESQI